MKLPPGLKYFVFAGVLGLIAVFMVNGYISSRLVSAPISPTSQVVVAELDIAPGTVLSTRELRIASWPRDIVPAKALSDSKELEGRVVQIPIGKGEPVLFSKLAPAGTSAGLGGLLDHNNLAVTVKTDEVSGVAGFVNPGDRIDVLVQMASPGGEDFSKIILQNIKVLSKGQIWDQTTDKNHPQVVPTVTLEVTPEQAETLNLASFQGKVRLALRNQMDRTEHATRGVITSQLAYKQPAVVEKKEPPRHSRSVQVIKGTQVKDTEL